MFLGIAYPSRERLFQLEVPNMTARSIMKVPETKSIRSDLKLSDRGTTEITLRLVDPDMARVFTPFCEDVAAATAAATSDEDAVTVLVDRFTHWRNLLTSSGGSALSANQALGLYGELWVMQNQIIPICGQSAPGLWTGPDGDDHDFIISGIGLEVKATMSDEPVEIVIHGERQLSSLGLRHLYLIVLKLTVMEGGAGETLVGAVAGTRTFLKGMSLSEFNDKLLEVGYLDNDAGSLSATSYSIRSIQAFRVSGEFPRLVEQNLPLGVGSIQYRIAMSALSPWECPLEEIESRLEENMNGQSDGTG